MKKKVQQICIYLFTSYAFYVIIKYKNKKEVTTMFVVNAKCDFCGEETRVGAPNVEKRLMCTRDGSAVWMTYFVCRKCGVRNFVQADDEYTNKLLEEETKLVVKVMKQKKFGKTPHRKQSERRKQIEQDLARTRKTLMSALRGEIVKDSITGATYIVSFNDSVS